jgi:hypothetical protein
VKEFFWIIKINGWRKKVFFFAKKIWRNRGNPRSYARRSMLEKGVIFQLISTLFCEVKRGFVDR